ncbi:hypothetical protein MSAN_01516200 [Mycena sanguinolenta]|uniref:Ricin B lectin domain-containing protein n=1 Tax=Mycena sanguinolenta TaxID=230812 RepID=A0A8H6Y368_9AGAR|nr:hypothetical protein MSAN_01516200 [Mycena sanguinolenta]
MHYKLFSILIVVNLTAIALVGTFFWVTDFQGHVLDDSFGISTNGNPVIGFSRNNPDTANQQWSLVVTSNPTQFNIQNRETNTFLSYSGAPSGSMTFAQAAIESTPRSFKVVQSSGAIGQFNILDVSTGLALTAWNVSTRRGSTITPVL